jgi:hypothetical protein
MEHVSSWEESSRSDSRDIRFVSKNKVKLSP